MKVAFSNSILLTTMLRSDIKSSHKTFLFFINFRFLALPTLLSAPRDYDRVMSNLPLRKIYEVEPEVLGALVQTGSALANDLDYAQEYRRELARAHSELYLVTDNAVTLSLLHHRPLREFIDPRKVERAKRACNSPDPISTHLNPSLHALGLPQM
jgi:hypothetical protein